MMTEAELITAANEGFRKWLTNEEIKDYVEAERARVAKTPGLYLVAFNSKQGFVSLDVSVVKMTKIVDEAGKLTDLELLVVNDEVTEPIPIKTSAFQPDAHPHIKFCRVFKTAKHRNEYYDDIRYLADLSGDYKLALIEMMRRQMRF